MTDDGPVEKDTITSPSRALQAIEVSVFLALILPSMFVDLFLFRQGKAGFVIVAWSTMLRDLGLVGVILLFLWHNHEPLTKIGWTARSVWLEILWGIGLFFPMTVAAQYVDRAFKSLGLSTPARPTPSYLQPTGEAQLAVALLLVIIVAFSEETMFRGYLLLRFTGIFRSLILALLLASTIFAIGHGYEGETGMATVGFMGLVFGVVYIWRKSLVAPMTMHFLQDFIGVVVVPFFSHH